MDKTERLQLRLDPREKDLLERAAEIAHLSVSAFVLSAAAAQAEQLLADRDVIALSKEGASAFLEALQRPAEVNDRLAAAVTRPRKFTWID